MNGIAGTVLDIPLSCSRNPYKELLTGLNFDTLTLIYTQTPGGAAATTLPAGTKITQNPDGSISLGGKVLPPGTAVQTNPDGSISLQGIVLDIPRENYISSIETESLITDVCLILF